MHLFCGLAKEMLVSDTEGAVKKRKRPQLNVECSMDAGIPAVFYCSRCKKPFCEDCIGRESGIKTLCIHCAGVEETIEDEEQRELSRRLSSVKKKSSLLTLLSAIAIVLIAVNAYILVNNQLEEEPIKASSPVVSPQLLGISMCRANLEVLAAEAATYSKLVGHPPASLEELSGMLEPAVETKDPVSHKHYIIESDEAGNITAHCPTPEAHGVAGIVAVPGKPARLIYKKGGQP